MKTATLRKKDLEKKELSQALELWNEACRALEDARRNFNAAANSFETEAAIHEMSSAEARRSLALCKIRNITMARTVAEKISGEKGNEHK
ncbi:MAG: hypothetical protein IJY86_12450 [Clostridia bacterium]|nr:hypothetical protein [Clostridia bacterium]